MRKCTIWLCWYITHTLDKRGITPFQTLLSSRLSSLDLLKVMQGSPILMDPWSIRKLCKNVCTIFRCFRHCARTRPSQSIWRPCVSSKMAWRVIWHIYHRLTITGKVLCFHLESVQDPSLESKMYKICAASMCCRSTTHSQYNQ